MILSPVSLFVAVSVAHGLAVMSPGPDLAIVSRQTLAHGRTAGLRTALGVACGIMVHVTYALFGLNWAIEQIPWLLNLLRAIGAGLLIWIGVQGLRAQPLPAEQPADATARPAAHDFAIGFATNVLNIKAMMFFVALCAAAVGSDVPAGLRIILGAWMVLTTAAWFSLVAWSLGHPRVRQQLRANAHWIDRAMGGVLICLALALLITLFSPLLI